MGVRCGVMCGRQVRSQLGPWVERERARVAAQEMVGRIAALLHRARVSQIAGPNKPGSS
jgi:hypothetical protein